LLLVSFCHRIHLAHLEAHADDGAADIFLSIVRIRRGDDVFVGEQVKAGEEAFLEVREQADAMLAGGVIKRVFFRTLC
jgi:hypothetical protein